MTSPSVSLREHFEALLKERDTRSQQRFEAQTLAINAALAAAKEAVTKAETATEKRLEGMNEFRGALTDQSNRQVSLVQFDALRDTLSERIANLTGRMDRTEGRSGGYSSGWGYLIGIIGAGAAIAALIWRAS